MKAQSPSSSTPTKRSKPRRRSAGILPATTKAPQAWTVPLAVAELQRHGSRYNIEGMARFGIVSDDVYGVSKPILDKIAREIGRNHELGLQLWNTGNHDARLLGMLISDSKTVTGAQMEAWVKEFDNWDVCDGTCCHLFAAAKPAWQKSLLWTRRENEFEKRAGFALIAYLAIHDKAAKDAAFAPCLKAIERESWDDRNFVRKAVNWALRNIGKRNKRLNRQAIACGERIKKQGTRAARWIAADALRELRNDAVQLRLSKKT
jgi:3-methyladenine DNA glycosylase AlkD